ncbi:MAG: (Fe-S)-binding protein [Desulfobacterales bacterium]
MAEKAASIEKTGASVVATGCPACMIQLSDMLAKAGKNIRVAHGVELYAEKWLTSQTTSG